jgi:hypothetical protein
MSSTDESSILPDIPATTTSRGSLQMLQLLPEPRLLYPLGAESLQVVNPHLLLGEGLPESASAPNFENQTVFGRPRRYAFAQAQPTIPTVQRLPSQIEFGTRQTTLAPTEPTPQREDPQAQSKEFAVSSENTDTPTILPAPSNTSASSPPISTLSVSLQMSTEETSASLQTGDIPPVVQVDSASETFSLPMSANTADLIAPIQRRIDIASEVARTNDPSLAPAIGTADPLSSFITTPEIARKEVVEPIASLSSDEPHLELTDVSLQTSTAISTSEGTIQKATHLPFPIETPEKATFAFSKENSPVNLQSTLSRIEPQISRMPTSETALEILPPAHSFAEDEHSTGLREAVEPSATESANSISTVAPTSSVPPILQAFESPELMPPQNQLQESEALATAPLKKSDSIDSQQKVTSGMDTEPVEIGISESLQKPVDLQTSLAHENTTVSDDKALPKLAIDQPVEEFLSRQAAINTTDQSALSSASHGVPETSLPVNTSESVPLFVQPKAETPLPPDSIFSFTSEPFDTPASLESASSPQQPEVLYQTPIQRQVAAPPEPVVSVEPIAAETSVPKAELPTTPSDQKQENREQVPEEVAEWTTPAFESEPAVERASDIPQTQLQSEETLQLSSSRDSGVVAPLPPTLAESEQHSPSVEPSPIQRQVAAPPEPVVSVEPIAAETSVPKAELPTTPSAQKQENREQVPEEVAEWTTPAFGSEPAVERASDIPQTQLQSEETLQLSFSRDSGVVAPLLLTLAESEQHSPSVEQLVDDGGRSLYKLAESEQHSPSVEASPIQRQVAAPPEPVVSVEPIAAETSVPKAELPTTPSDQKQENREQVPEEVAERTTPAFGGEPAVERASELPVVQAALVVQEFPALTYPRLGLQRQPEHLVPKDEFSVLTFGAKAQELPLYTQPPAEQQVSVSAVQRQEELPAQVAPPPPQTDHTNAPPSPSGGQDQLEALAQAVYALLRHRIVRERERQGAYIGRLPW